MSLFKSIVDGFSTVGNLVNANLSPYTVQLVKVESYHGICASQKGKFVILYKKPGCYDCVFANTSASPKNFSLFRLTKDGEALSLYKALNAILTVLGGSTSSLYSEEKVQAVCNSVREHPTWNCAHVAAHTGLFEAFRIKEVLNLISTPCSVSGVSPLMAGVMGGQKHCIHEMLLVKARVDMADQRGWTVYHYAVKYLPDVIDFLVDHDKDKTFDWMDNKGMTPLYMACLEKPEQNVTTPKEKHESVEMLIVAGADPSISKADCLPIHIAVKLGEMKCIELILLKCVDQKNAVDKKFGGTPLHWAHTREVAELLCQLECDVNAVSYTKHTPLQIMLEKKRFDCMMELLCYGANCNIGDTNGNTPLHWAVQQDDIDLIQTFVVFGADVNLKNRDQHSARHQVAVSKGKNKEIILFMLNMSGARRCSKTVKGCMAGCSSEGKHNGKPDEKFKPFLTLDKMALFDDMLCTVVSCSSNVNTGKGDSLLEMTDGPSSIGDRVLCLDGGGIRGLILIQVLAAIEDEAGVPIQDLFEWIGGTSTGGILALGIGIGKTLPYLKGLYFRLKDEVFKGQRPYDSIPFETLLKREFGEERVMTDIKHPKVMVTGVLADRFPAELHLFRTYQPTLDKPAEHKGSFEAIKPPNEQLMWKSARSTGAAPTYFRTFGQFMDGGVMANNPTLDVLTEIHEYNMGLKFRTKVVKSSSIHLENRSQSVDIMPDTTNEAESIQPLGCVVSIGCGRNPVVAREHIDVFKPSGIMEAHKVIKGTTALVSLLIDQASVAEGRPVDRARAWCSMINVPYYRFSPQLSENISLDMSDNKTLINMMWETQCYLVTNKHRIAQVAQLLKAGCGERSRRPSKLLKQETTSLNDLDLHAT